MQLQMKNISIEFPGVKALDEASFDTATGSVHALIGANGAGKSTLMKVLSGAYTHYTGDILIDGEKSAIRSPKDAQEKGIQIVYQEVDTALIPYLTVGENIMLNDLVADKNKKLFVDWRKLHNDAEKVLASLHLRLSSKKLVSELTLAEKQMVLIARAVSTECKFLILDEPTAPLSLSETRELFRIVNDLSRNDVGIIFISHRLPELFEICDHITVMRDGRFITKERIADSSPKRVVEQMLGEKMEEQITKTNTTTDKLMLETARLSDGVAVKDVSLKVYEGEIIGLAGLVGAGKTELCKLLFGAAPVKSGEIKLKGKTLSLSTPSDAVKNGIAFVPEERRKEGILVEESVTTNLSASSLDNFLKVFSFLDFRTERIKTEETISALAIKTPSSQTLVKNLSGGNQQKVAIGKWLITDADVYIFDEPTKGVDVGAKKDIFELINGLAAKGKSVIYASCELTEVLGITDRIYVIYDGRVMKELTTTMTNEEELLYLSTGGN